MLPSEFIMHYMYRPCTDIEKTLMQKIADEINSRLEMSVCEVQKCYGGTGYGVYVADGYGAASPHGNYYLELARAALRNIDDEVRSASG